jgi:hypothetical protein
MPKDAEGMLSNSIPLAQLAVHQKKYRVLLCSAGI